MYLDLGTYYMEALNYLFRTQETGSALSPEKSWPAMLFYFIRFQQQNHAVIRSVNLHIQTFQIVIVENKYLTTSSGNNCPG